MLMWDAVEPTTLLLIPETRDRVCGPGRLEKAIPVGFAAC